jgi:hypothetical protein
MKYLLLIAMLAGCQTTKEKPMENDLKGPHRLLKNIPGETSIQFGRVIKSAGTTPATTHMRVTDEPIEYCLKIRDTVPSKRLAMISPVMAIDTMTDQVWYYHKGWQRDTSDEWRLQTRLYSSRAMQTYDLLVLDPDTGRVIAYKKPREPVVVVNAIRLEALKSEYGKLYEAINELR